MANEQEKEVAAHASMSFVQDGYVVGLGTGSTASYAIELLGARVKSGLQIRGVPTSIRSQKLAASLGIPLATLDEIQEIDVTIDGADEIDASLRLIKGGGGALLGEKIVASASKQLVIVADSSKLVQVLGSFPLPVEVVPFAEAVVAKKIAFLGATVQVRQDAQGKAFITDGGHHILDCKFDRIADPAGLAGELDSMPGVVEHGLFIDMADVVLVGNGAEAVESRRGDPWNSRS